MFLTACKDQIVGPETITKTVAAPSICTDPTYPEAPNVNFPGVLGFDSVEQTRFRVYWDQHDEATAYLIYVSKEGEELKLYQAADKNLNELWVEGLEPQTNYQVSVRLLDDRGLYDVNQKVLLVSTNNVPTYNNAKSLYFDGSAAASLAASEDILPNTGFTISMWFKTNHVQSPTEAKLINFHHDFSAGTAMGIGVRGSQIFAAYRNANGDLKELAHNFNYHDNAWHHVAVTYNGSAIGFYLDGNKVSQSLNDFIGFGAHAASIGSYTGRQKGFTGLIDEVSLWTAALGSQEVAAIRNAGSPGNLRNHSRQANLQSWYRMGDDTRDTQAGLRDQMGRFRASTLNIEAGDFTLDHP